MGTKCSKLIMQKLQILWNCLMVVMMFCHERLSAWSIYPERRGVKELNPIYASIKQGSKKTMKKFEHLGRRAWYGFEPVTSPCTSFNSRKSHPLVDENSIISKPFKVHCLLEIFQWIQPLNIQLKTTIYK